MINQIPPSLSLEALDVALGKSKTVTLIKLLQTN